MAAGVGATAVSLRGALLKIGTKNKVVGTSLHVHLVVSLSKFGVTVNSGT